LISEWTLRLALGIKADIRREGQTWLWARNTSSGLDTNRTLLEQVKHTHGVLLTRPMAPGDGRSTPDSLFSEDGDDGPIALPVALRSTPPIPGLWAFPGLLPLDVASEYSI
jgi:hypothetical protein